MNILAAILLIGASGHAERSMETDSSIAAILAQCAWGALSDVYDNGRILRSSIDDSQAAIRGIRLRIDGQPREGMRAWGEAGWRVAGYVASDGSEVWGGSGSIEYSYRLAIRGYDVFRRTRIQDGRVVLKTDAWWTEVVPVGRSTRRIPIHVSISIRADETGSESTRIVGTATGTADTREFRCGIVRRIAERQAAEQLDIGLRNALAEIERRGRGAYASGSDIAGILDGFRFGLDIGVRLRR